MAATVSTSDVHAHHQRGADGEAGQIRGACAGIDNSPSDDGQEHECACKADQISGAGCCDLLTDELGHERCKHLAGGSHHGDA